MAEATADCARKSEGQRRSLKRRMIAMPRALAALILVLLIAALGGVVALAGTMSYTITYGDTLSELAVKHDTDVETLAELNGIDDPDYIIAGEELLIPVDDETTGPETYTVRPGDTLRSIADEHDVEVAELAAWNNLDDPDLIIAGDKLALPADASEDQRTDAQPESAEQSEASVDSESDAASEEESGAAIDALSSEPEPVRLHLVREGETVEDIAASYDVEVLQVLAANALPATEVTPGKILKIPDADLRGVQLVGMPAKQEQWPLQSEIAAASLATSYWGEPIPTSDILSALPSSPNPHLGFRGNPQGPWGMTDDYGVYHGPLADALESFGFQTEAFYSDGDPAALTAQIDAGAPVVVWVTHDLVPQDRTVIDDDLGRYSLVPEQHALAVYGYDQDGIFAVDVASGAYVHALWEPFLASWSLFDGMALAVSVEDAG